MTHLIPIHQKKLIIRRCIFLLLIVTGIFSNASAKVSLPNIFTDNMVLQREINVRIWGEADKNKKITVEFNGQKLSAKADKEGYWEVFLAPMEAGGPFDMKISGDEEILLKNILIGDVWICSGQSNMEWIVQNVKMAEEEISYANYPSIRFFTVPNKVSTTPLDDIGEAEWKVCSPETVGDFSAVGYFFGKGLKQQIDVPIGLINTSWGGTVIETWTSTESLQKTGEFDEELKKLEMFDEASSLAKLKENMRAIIGYLPVEDEGYLNDKPIFASPRHDFSGWKEAIVPGLWEEDKLPGFDGVVWYCKEIILDEKDLKGSAKLKLGPIDDSDITWLNGKKIGAMEQQYSEPREYDILPEDMILGKNILVVRVDDTGGGGGFWGNPTDMILKTADKTISLAGKWRYKVGQVYLQTAIDPNSLPSLLYNGMIHPIIKFPIKGSIWYQGEANADRAWQYQKLFPNMINNWREVWGQGDFPFLFVQLANFMAPADKPGDSDWAELREAQTMTLKLPNTGMAVAIDIGEAFDIHPRNKQDVGFRLANSALKIAYGKDIVPMGPIYKSMKIEGNKAIITFDYIGSGLDVRDKYGYAKGFTIAGADKVFHWAKAYKEGNTIVVESDKVKNPVAVRYGWADNPDDVNLYNMEGLPASPFRTDDWPGITQKKK